VKKYQGITKKILNNGEEAIFVRFKYLSKTYPVKNFTKLYNCKTIKQAFDKLQEVKVLIRENKDPFSSKVNNLNTLFYEKLEENLNNKKWRKDTTAKQYKYFYETNIKQKLGHKRLDKITYTDLDNIIKNLSHTKSGYHKKLKQLLNPIFKDALKRKEIYSNPLDLIVIEKVDKKQKISLRSMDDNLVIVKKLYKSIQEYQGQYKKQRVEIRIFFMLVLLTAHRYGELLKLRKEDVYIDKNLIVSQTDITKTKEDYHFPIPEECFEYIKNIESGLLFPNLTYGSLYMIFQRIVKKAEINLFNNKNITIHDTRTLMLNIMIRNGIDSRLADTCLDHKQPSIIEHYLDFSYNDKVKAFEKYWSLIRD